MAFLGSIGKFVGGLVAPVVKAIPATISGFASGGKGGAVLGALGSLQAGSGAGPAQFGGVQQLPSIFSTLGGPYQLPQVPFPMTSTSSQLPMVQVADVPALTQSVFNIIVKLADRLGIPIRRPSSVVRIGRNIIAKLLRFARANPGLTIINLLANLGLAANEVTELITWYTTKGKKHRRIKVTNVKALNRSVRRLEGFRRLSHRVEMALARRGAARSITRSRRCPRCRKSPCSC